ncbi:metal-dependent hydrolase, partial [Alicyclobacillus fodiniaquatilis]
MLGKTHMAIGAVGAALVSPIVLQTKWVDISHFFQGNWSHIPHTLGAEAVLVSAAVAGSLMPDLDQADSTMARKVERLGQVIMFGLLALLTFLMHVQTHWYVWLGALFISWVLGERSDIARMIGLCVIAVGILFWGIQHETHLLGTIFIGVWVLFAMLTGHRTFTHSALGWALLTAGLHMSFGQMHPYPQMWKNGVIGVSVGYGLHLIADAFAGGVPIAWPIKKR